jgi:type I restriction enzyme M protein
MDQAAHQKIVSFIWSIADDCLRDVFVRGKYRDVILPMFVLRRIDCLLEDSKEQVLAEVTFQKEEAKMAVLDPEGLRDASGQVFYNTSRFTLKTLLGNPSQLQANFNHYLDGFSGTRFDFMLSNPPYGKSWKTDQGQILEKSGSKVEIIDPRFEVILEDAFGEKQTVSAAPAVDDGQLLFLMEMVDKMKRLQDSPQGSRIATVHNGSALFTGNAGGGASNIRQYLIENDLLDAIVQLPNNIFYNTGITTYIWVLSNHKPKARQGKVQLIDASGLYEKLRKNLGEKNCQFTPAHVEQITRAYLEMADTGKGGVDGLKSQIFDGRDFGYWKITVERPLRKSAQFTRDWVAALRFDKRLNEEMSWMFGEWGEAVYEDGFLKEKKRELENWLEAQGIERKAADIKKLLTLKFWKSKLELLEAGQALHREVGEEISHDFNMFEKQVKKAAKKQGLKLGAPQLKTILDAVSWTDPEAEPVKAKDGFEPDSDLRDTENVPLNWLEGETDTRKVIQEIRALEAETEGLLDKILDFGG